jgi:hypothetical protein
MMMFCEMDLTANPRIFIHMKIIRTISIVVAIVAAISVVASANATTLSIGDSRELGLISKNQPADPASSTGYLNILLGQALGTGPVHIGNNDFTRTINDPLAGNYPSAVFALDLGAVTTINLGLGYTYLLAKYDGQNWGSEVWYVGGLTGSITIPLYGNGEQYAVSHVYLFNPNGETVPEGGMTLVLLGTAVSAVFVGRRFIGA